ncbi:hypothetical protein K8R78_06820 [bacterium]|nr:hypothetical protein [bacterium]
MAQQQGKAVGILAVGILIIVGFVVFFVSDGEFPFPGFVVPFIIFAIFGSVIRRAVKNAKNAQGGGSQSSTTTASRPTVSGGGSSSSPYRYDIRTGQVVTQQEPSSKPYTAQPARPAQPTQPARTSLFSTTKAEAEPSASYDEQQEAIRRIIAEQKQKTDQALDETGEIPELTEEEKQAQREQRAEVTSQKLEDAADIIRQRRESGYYGSDKGSQIPPGHTICLSCGAIVKVRGRKTRCPACGSKIEAN